jgi:hypothetical protein
MFDHLHCLVDRSIGMTTQGFPRSRARAAGCSSSAGARAAI